MNNYDGSHKKSIKERKLIDIIHEFVVDGTLYELGNLDMTNVVLLAKEEGQIFLEIPKDFYVVSGYGTPSKIVEIDRIYLKQKTHIQVVRMWEVEAREYVTDLPNVKNLQENYNTLVKDFTVLTEMVRKHYALSDSRDQALLLPQLEEEQLWVTDEWANIEAVDIADIFKGQRAVNGMVFATNDYGNFELTGNWRWIQRLVFNLRYRDNLLFMCTVPIYTTVAGRVRGRVFLNDELMTDLDLEMELTKGTNLLNFCTRIADPPRDQENQVYLELLFIPYEIVHTYTCVCYKDQLKMIIYGSFLKDMWDDEETVPTLSDLIMLKKKRLRIEDVGNQFRQIPKPVNLGNTPNLLRGKMSVLENVAVNVTGGDTLLKWDDFWFEDPSLQIIDNAIKPIIEIRSTKKNVNGRIQKFVLNNLNFEVNGVTLT